jgi:hypothetical protein
MHPKIKSGEKLNARESNYSKTTLFIKRDASFWNNFGKILIPKNSARFVKQRERDRSTFHQQHHRLQNVIVQNHKTNHRRLFCQKTTRSVSWKQKY